MRLGFSVVRHWIFFVCHHVSRLSEKCLLFIVKAATSFLDTSLLTYDFEVKWWKVDQRLTHGRFLQPDYSALFQFPLKPNVRKLSIAEPFASVTFRFFWKQNSFKDFCYSLATTNLKKKIIDRKMFY